MCPPGELPSPKENPTIVVASIMRSGTHLLIDTLFNNFTEYRNAPLYIDLDEWIRTGGTLAELKGLTGVIIKTHYPQVSLPIEPLEMKSFFQDCQIFTPVREHDKIWRSSTSTAFDAYSSEDEFKRDLSAFSTFWEPFEALQVPFSSLVADDFTPVVTALSEYLDLAPAKRFVAPFKKGEKFKVYFYKLLTRLLGKQSPIINTTIGFAKK